MRLRGVLRQKDLKLAHAKGRPGEGWANTRNTKHEAPGSGTHERGIDAENSRSGCFAPKHKKGLRTRDAKVVRRKGRYERSTSHKGSN
eukprot:5628512-Pleurochrysis_carterae.AAC.4